MMDPQARFEAGEELIREMSEAIKDGTYDWSKEPSTRKGLDKTIDARVEINRDLIARYDHMELMLGLNCFRVQCMKASNPTELTPPADITTPVIKDISDKIEEIYTKYGTTYSQFKTAFEKCKERNAQEK